jgi:hypothetical protein
MDKLEHYLDQVCRSIGGPRALRQHVRQELREHLLDAVAQHKAAGMTEEKALDRALEDFGGPEQVRSELEATHGQRLLPVVIDKAMQWKEKTMKARWLWVSWANLALAAVIAMEALFITFLVIFIVPRFQRLMRDGIVDPVLIEQTDAGWMPDFVKTVSVVGGNYTILWIVAPAALWGLFEWRVRSEHKPFMRLSVLGSVAVALTVVAALTAGSLVVSFCLGVPAAAQLGRPFARDQVATIDTSLAALEQAKTKEDWPAMQEHADRASGAMDNLVKMAPVLPSLTSPYDPAQLEELRAHAKAANDSLRTAQQAIRDKDATQLGSAMKAFREAYGPVQAAAKKPAT